MVDFGKFRESNIFFPKSISPEWKCKVRIFDKGTYSEKTPYTIDMTNQKVKSVKDILPISADYTKFSLFNIIAKMDENADDITMSDLAKLKKQFKNDDKNSVLKSLGVTNVKWDGNAGKGTVELNYREVVVIDFETAAECQKTKNKTSKCTSKNNKKGDMDYDGFLQYLAFREGSGDYGAVNKKFNYLGRYQFGEQALYGIGMYENAGKYNNDWTGTFIILDKNGKKRRIKGKEGKKAFLNSPHTQEYAIEKYVIQQWDYINSYNLNQYIGNKNFKKQFGCQVTKSGLIAGAHLIGIGKLTKFFEEFKSTGKIKDMTKYMDGTAESKNRTSVVDYIKDFAGYDMSEVTKSN